MALKNVWIVFGLIVTAVLVAYIAHEFQKRQDMIDTLFTLTVEDVSTVCLHDGNTCLRNLTSQAEIVAFLQATKDIEKHKWGNHKALKVE